METCCPCFFYSNNTIEENDDTLSLSFSFSLTQKKAMVTSCRCFLHLNTTKEKCDGNKLPSPSSLQQHHRRKRSHIAIVFFFSTTPP